MSDFYNKYPYTDFHELNLDWIIERVKQLTEDWLATQEAWNNTQEQWQQLYDYVHDYFANLDVQDEINNKINQMILDGTFITIVTPTINQTVVDATTTWLADHITQPTTPAIDNTLSIAGAAADAKAAGDAIALTMQAGTETTIVQAMNYTDYFTDADDAMNMRSYFISNDITNAMIDNLPSYGNNQILITFSTAKSGSNANNGKLQFCLNTSTNTLYYRRKTTTWNSWTSVQEIATNAASTSFKPASSNIVSSSNYNDYFTDADNAPAQRSYFILNNVTNVMIANLPHYGNNQMLFTFDSLVNGTSGKLQISLDTATNILYFRRKTSSWNSWTSIQEIAANAAANGLQPGTSSIVQSGNYTDYFTDADDAPSQRSFFILNDITNVMIANLPNYGNNGVLFTLDSLRASTQGKIQIYVNMYNNITYYRRKTSSWNAWRKFTDSYKYANVAIFGDSYSTMDDYLPAGYASYYPHTGNDVNSLTDTWWYKFLKARDANMIVNDSYSGSTVADSTYGDGQSFVRRITARYDSTTITDNKPDVIFIFGGTNDAYRSIPIGTEKYANWTASDLEEFSPALCYIFDYLQKWCPFSNIIFITSGIMNSSYKAAIASACSHYGIQNVVINGFAVIDNHPTAAGMTTIANELSNNII